MSRVRVRSERKRRPYDSAACADFYDVFKQISVSHDVSMSLLFWFHFSLKSIYHTRNTPILPNEKAKAAPNGIPGVYEKKMKKLS
jgi:hypothetical protein